MTGERGSDPAAWDAFVAASDPGSYLQLSAWARVKATNGWSAHRVVVDGPAGRVGAQVLVRRPRGFPWGFAYAPRGPVLARWGEPSIVAITDALRAAVGDLGRIATLRIDPEIERDGPLDADGALRDALARTGWRPAPSIQPEATRVIDLAADEAALWGDLRKKWRQYVNKARSGGVRIVEAEGDRLGDFHRIYAETARRAGFLIRSEAAYRDVWEAFRPAGGARLLIAEEPDGTPSAALFLVRCGPRVVEPYGGMTGAGAASRANYLLKWEAIRSSREQGATSYDLWGLAHPGIAHFKTGFGGREVRYVGAWELVLDPLGRRAYGVGQALRVALARRRAGLRGSGDAVSYDAAGEGEAG